MSRERKFSPCSLLPALTLLMPFSLERAHAACAPEPPVDNATATCTGTTTNQSGSNGYGTVFLSNNAITVQPGASVTGTDNGVVFVTGSVANFGSVSGISNNGIFVVGTGDITNSGSISGGNIGASITNGALTNANTGTITSGNIGVFFQDSGLLAGTPASVVNGGAISGNQFGIQFRELNHATGGAVTNSGTISAIAVTGIGISALTTATVKNEVAGIISAPQFGIDAAMADLENEGRIESTGAAGAAVHANTVNITKNTGTITSLSFGVQTSSAANITNSGTIESTARIAILAGSADIDNSGTIQAPTGQSALSTPGLATVKNSGLFVGGANAIFSSGGAVNVTDNTGTIRATDATGRAINAFTTATVINSSGGKIEANGPGGVAIRAVTLANVANAGSIRALGVSGTAITAGSVALSNSTSGVIEVSGPNAIAIQAGLADITNAGVIDATANIAIDASDSIIVRNSGAITAGSSAVRAGNGILVTNSGTIQTGAAGSETIASAGNVELMNAGRISAIGSDSVAITAGLADNAFADVTNTKTGFIAGGKFGIAVSGAVNVTNSGVIRGEADTGVAISATVGAFLANEGTVEGIGAAGGGVVANGPVTVGNTIRGVISGGASAIESVLDSVDVDNAGTIQAADGIAVRAATTATVKNFGTIRAIGATSFGIHAGTVDAINSGTISGNTGIGASSVATVANLAAGVISGNVNAIVSDTGVASVSNAGTIETTSVFGGNAIQAATTVTVDNLGTGTIRASGDGTAIAANIANVTNSGLVTGGFFGIDATSVNLINTGTISSDTGIRASGLNNVGSTISNSGTIAGTGGTAIKLSPAADTLTLLPGSKIIGAIDMGGGADTINIVNDAPILSRVSSFFRFLSVNSLNILNFTGTINANAVTVDSGGMPAVQTGDSIATLDPTAFGRADRALMNFTGGISSLVQGRLGGTAANGSVVQVVSFAPTGASGRTEEGFAAISRTSARSYAAERTRPLTHSFTYADAPYNVWTSGFGGASVQKGDNIILRSVASAGAGVIGIDRQVRPDLLIGAFAGGGTGRLSVELNSQSVDTDYVTGGLYGRFEWVSHFLDFTLQGGGMTNKSKRLVLNDSVPSGSETATASYNSWYISPEIAYGRRYHFANGYTLTPVGRIRYLAGTFDGYNEAGSAQNLVVNRRTLHDLEERAEVELSEITGIGVGSFRTNVHGGFIALQRLGNPTVNTVLIGQDLSFTTPGKASTGGVVAGAGFDFRATDRVALFGAFEATLMSDHTRTAAAKAGLKLAF